MIPRRTLPKTSIRLVDLIFAEFAIVESSSAGLVLRETAADITFEKGLRYTKAHPVVQAAV